MVGYKAKMNLIRLGIIITMKPKKKVKVKIKIKVKATIIVNNK